MPKQFHKEEFDDSTRLKLDIFRRYVRKWIPVFLNFSQDRRNFQRACLFDFFSGPGMDSAGNPGSPMIIYEELKNYCGTHPDKKSKSIVVDLFFNDVESEKAKSLEEHLAKVKCQQQCCNIQISSRHFQELLLSR